MTEKTILHFTMELCLPDSCFFLKNSRVYFLFCTKETIYLLSHNVKTYKSHRQNRNDHYTQTAIL